MIKIYNGFIDPVEEFRGVIVALIRALNERPRIDINDTINFSLKLTKADDYPNYFIDDVTIDIKKFKTEESK